MQRKSIYKYASEAGVPAGLYMTLMSACLLLSVKLPALPMMLLPLCLGFPVLLWFLMNRISIKESAYNKFSSLWLGGIYTVIFGSLICMLMSALYIVFVEPNFVNLYIGNALSAVESTPMAPQYESSIRMMREAMDAHVLPTGLEFVTTMAWFTCFCGSILSLLIAAVMTYAGKRVNGQPV